MSKIDELIKEMCPNGVEYKKINEIGETFTGLSGKNKKDFENGNCRYITYSNIYNNPDVRLDKDDFVYVKNNEKQNYIIKGDILITGSSENIEDSGMIAVVTEEPKEKIYLNSFCFGLRLNDKYKNKIIPGYSKHIFRSEYFRTQILKCSFGVTRYNLNKKMFLELNIPVPPLEIQEEVVKVLDKFSELEVELEAELEARKKQYEFYSKKLFKFKQPVKYVPIGEISSVITDYVANGSFAEIAKNVQYKSEPDYAVLLRTVDYSNGFNPDKFVYIDKHAYGFLKKSKLFGGEIIINNVGAGVGTTFLCPKLDINMSLAPNSIMIKTPNNKFYYYWLKSIYGQEAIKSTVSKSAMPKFNKTEFRKIMVPVLPEQQQNEIVNILEKIDKFIHDTSEGLPAEIKLRRKQYEYYRNKLLDFKEVIA